MYREDLVRNRENGWALTGMEQALRARRMAEEGTDLTKEESSPLPPEAEKKLL